MFKHILLATDGSEPSGAMVSKALELASTCGARVTAINVIVDFHVFTFHSEMLAETREQYQRESGAHARVLLDDIHKRAQQMDVPCDTIALGAERPYEAILKTAEEQGCDLICVASHGRHGVKGMLLGSETQKVLSHSRVPVLVFR